jgi:radical SAM protein with 4Fe4S-binding SPASM domain
MIALQVLPDGETVACPCFDARRRHPLGNLRNMSIDAAWRSPARRAFLERFALRALPSICRACAMYTPYDEVLSLPAFASYRPAAHHFWTVLVDSAERPG